ncbi:YciI family protein [Arthrobacter sp. S2(2024)]|uniref:YciI family protein n=1 Tax=Arthrobacter sp. S2(2024) TaxID=3111911 RepID=UPI002FC90076
MNIFIVIVSYVTDFDDIVEALPEHNAWLDSTYQRGVLIASGRQIPRVGGVLLAP